MAGVVGEREERRSRYLVVAGEENYGERFLVFWDRDG